MMTLSGSGCSGLPPPARPTLAARCVPVRGPGGTFVLWVREGGTLELCASLTGSCCLASKAARRALRRCTSAHNAAMSASFSCSESRVRSGKLSMLSLSDTATLLVKRVVPSGGLSNYKISICKGFRVETLLQNVADTVMSQVAKIQTTLYDLIA